MLLTAILSCLPLLADGLPQQASPSLREIRKLVDEFFALDLQRDDEVERGMEIARRLDSYPLDSSAKKKRWRKELLSAAGKRQQLTRKAGEYWTWEEERRGRFLIGGETKKPKALLISMHGGGVGSADARGAFSGYNAPAKKLGWLAIFPQALEATEYGWTDSGTEEWVLGLVEAALRTWDIPSDRVFFAGHSMGGFGAWVLGAHHADRLAAAAPSAGAPTPVYNYQKEIIDLQTGVIPNLRNLPMVVFQSRDDPQVPPEVNQFAAKSVSEARDKWGGYVDFEYWEVDGAGHGSPPGGNIAHLEKVAKWKRNPVPAKLLWQPVLSWKHRWYWLYWPRPRLGEVLVVTVTAESNSIHLESKNSPTGLQIFLPQELVDSKNEITVLFNGKEVWKGRAEPTLGSLLLSAVYGDEQMLVDSRIAPFG